MSGPTTTALAVGEGFFPLDEQLQLWDTHLSEGLAKQVLWLLGLLPDDLVERVLQRVAGLALSDSSIWRCGATWGERLRAVTEAEAALAQALPRGGVVQRGESHSGPRMGVSMDGTMVHIRNEGFKELKVGAVFAVESRREVPKGGGEAELVAHAVHNSYVGKLGGSEALGVLVWGEAHRRGWLRALDTVVVGDGAVWIWNQARLHFGYSLQLVDWYHAKQHLHAAAHVAWGEGSPEALRWVQRLETPLYQGQAWQVAAAIEGWAAKRQGEAAKTLRTEAGYFRNNKNRMQYLDMQEQGWPIGSGTVESAGKQFAARLAGPGMRWSRHGAERMIPLRAAILGQRFDQAWSLTYTSPPN